MKDYLIDTHAHLDMLSELDISGVGKVVVPSVEIKTMEKELYIDEDSDFSITCPYCNNEFIVECEELKDEIECPECNNIIELDWGDGCSCGDDECGHDCSHCHHDEEDDM